LIDVRRAGGIAGGADLVFQKVGGLWKIGAAVKVQTATPFTAYLRGAGRHAAVRLFLT
jgi:hypothetical protein